MLLLDLPREMLCNVLEYSSPEDLESLTKSSFHLLPFTLFECKRRLRPLQREQAKIPRERQEVIFEKGIAAHTLKSLYRQGRIDRLHYRTELHAVNENRDRKMAIIDVNEFEINAELQKLGTLKRTTNARVKELNRILGILNPKPKKKRKRGHGWSRVKKYKTST